MSSELREAWRDELSQVMLAKSVAVARDTTPAREVMFGELADAIIDRYDLAEHRHLVRFTESGWTIQHPVAERMTGMLLDCDLAESCADLLVTPPSAGLGDYWLTVEGLIPAEGLSPAEGSTRRPERCSTCGCELAYPTAIHVLDCREGE